ncbi:hypothetical protein [Amycolatopsis anabasis]|uniref:hypothetical protein n=1 Tax=Amycolatopsis anabasis TaxID=1840409 RepID=UPI00131C8C54|nr:hypothetical protein [Amycolatopsis anabasis]
MNRALRRLAVSQLRGLTDLGAWLSRRRVGLAPGDVELGYGREQVPMMLALAFVLGLETAVVGLLVPWPVVHVLDACAVLQVLGLAATAVVRPHRVGNGVLLLRNGTQFTLEVPLTSVAAVRAERKQHSGPTLRLREREFAVVVGNQTDVVVELSEPVAVVLNGTAGEATVLRFRADEPRAAVAAIKAALPKALPHPLG